MTSPLNFLAIRIASSVLPLAVGPAITTSGKSVTSAAASNLLSRSTAAANFFIIECSECTQLVDQ